jgi:ribosomal-protein-alanine N-acetyltransferase
MTAMPLVAPDPIHTARFVVRPVEESDLAALMLVNGVEQATKFLPYQTWTTPADASAWFVRMLGIVATGTALQFVVAQRHSGVAIGTCLLFKFDEHEGQAELGYVLGRDHWRRGCMVEALCGLIDAAFRTMPLRRLEAKVDTSNEASTRLLLRLGFTIEALSPERVDAKGRHGQDQSFGILSRDWPKVRPR